MKQHISRLTIGKRSESLPALTEAVAYDTPFHQDLLLSPAVRAQLESTGYCVWPGKGLTLINETIDLLGVQHG